MTEIEELIEAAEQVLAKLPIPEPVSWLYHKVVHTPTAKIVRSIMQGGLIPRLACEYKGLVPEVVRHLPVVWLASRLHFYHDAPVFVVDVVCLDRRRLYHVEDQELAWWVYQGPIPRRDVKRYNGNQDKG